MDRTIPLREVPGFDARTFVVIQLTDGSATFKVFERAHENANESPSVRPRFPLTLTVLVPDVEDSMVRTEVKDALLATAGCKGWTI